jgi:hypothetical protein
MSFGLTNAPATFQALINSVLHPFLRWFVLMFFDDILIYNPSWLEHLRHARLILQQLDEHKLSVFGPAGVLSQRVNQMLRVPNLDGDARRIHGGLSWFGQKKALYPAGRGNIVFPYT